LARHYQRPARSPNSFYDAAVTVHTGQQVAIFSKKTICNAPPFVYKPASQAPATPEPAMLGNSSTVERRTLTPLILVRIQVPQPILPKSPYFLGFPVVPDIVLASSAT
jgi:hypothetical protein